MSSARTARVGSFSLSRHRRTRRPLWVLPCCIAALAVQWRLGPPLPFVATVYQAAERDGDAAETDGDAGAGGPLDDAGLPVTQDPPVRRFLDRGRLLSWWQVLEQPLWRLLRDQGSGSGAISLDALREELGASSATGSASRQLQGAVQTFRDVMACLNVPAPPSEGDIEPYVSDVLPPPGLGRGPIWSVVDRAHGPGQQEAKVIVVVNRELMRRVSDAELRALVGLHVGRLMLGPQLPCAWKVGGWWILHRVYRLCNDVFSGGQLLLGQPAQRPPRRGKGSWGSLAALRDESLSSGLSIARDAVAIHGMSEVVRRRNRELMKAADRLAMIAAGSVDVAASAIAKAHDYACEGLQLSQRNTSMQQWSRTPSGQRLLGRSQQCLLLAPVSTPSSSVQSLHWAMTVAAVLLILMSVTLLSASVAAMTLNFLLAACAAGAVVSMTGGLRFPSPQTLHQGGTPGVEVPAARDAAVLSLGLYTVSAALVWWRCLQIQARGRNHTTVASLIQEALPAAAEAAAGAALLARCSASVRRRPLSELDHELHGKWTTALRGLSAKLADLRRLVGAGDTGVPMLGAAVATPESSAARLCAKLDLEARRALSAERMWMCRALDLENEGALCRALFWWLHDDGERGAWGSPRPASPADLGGEPSTLEKLSYPSLANAGVGHAHLHGSSADHERSAEELTCVSVALTEQHQQLEWLRAALRTSDGTSPPSDVYTPLPSTPIHALVRLFSTGYAQKRGEPKVRAFLEQCEGLHGGGRGASAWASAGPRDAAAGTDWSRTICGRGWEAAVPLALAAALAAAWSAAMGGAHTDWGPGSGWCFRLEAAVFLLANLVLQRRLQEVRLPYLWARLERCLLALEAERAKLVELVRLPGRPRPEQLAHIKALVLVQGVRTVQNLDYLALCIEAEALRSAAFAERSTRGVPKALAGAVIMPDQVGTKDFIHHCLQLFYSVLPRHGRRGQRQVSSDSDIHQAMAWFDVQSEKVVPAMDRALPARLKALQLALATSQRHLWMLFRLCEMRSMARPVAEQGTLSTLLNCQLRPIVLERRLELDALLPLNEPIDEGLPRGRSPFDSGRILGDLDSTTGSNDDGSDESSVHSGAVRRILASGSTSPASEDNVPRHAHRSARQRDLDMRSEEDAESFSDAASIAEGEGMHRILAASDASDGASSDSASSAGFNSFGVTHSSMWSGMSRSATSSASSLTEDMLTHRRPLLEGYAHALRPLFMTRGDIMHLLTKFPTQVLLGGPAAGTRSFAAHRELLEELFGSFLVAIKSPERRGKIKLAFGTSFAYDKAAYALGPLQTTLQLVAHGVRRTGHEQFPVVYEEEHEDEEKSEAAVSAAHDNGQEGQGVLEFEEIMVPLTEVSSRELFLAELMQSDQCQLLASLSQGAHSKYGHRALRRRRRTLRHVREATQLLVSVPDQ